MLFGVGGGGAWSENNFPFGDFILHIPSNTYGTDCRENGKKLKYAAFLRIMMAASLLWLAKLVPA